MVTRVETDEFDQAAPVTKEPRLRRYLARRGRQSGECSCISLLPSLLGRVLEIYRGAGMIGLPDVGDPFDVEAFRAFRVDPDQDSFVLFRKAQERLTRMPFVDGKAGLIWSWSKTTPKRRDWVNANRPVLELFLTAADRPDGIPNPTFDRNSPSNNPYLGEFAWLALLEASRLEEQGDMTGAWSLLPSGLSYEGAYHAPGIGFSALCRRGQLQIPVNSACGLGCRPAHQRRDATACPRRNQSR